MEKIPEIRELTYHDLNVLLDAYRNLQPEDAPLPPRPEVERMWREILADPRLSYLGAFDGPRLLSTCNAVVVPNLTRGGRPYSVIENVWTAPDRRREGLGSALLRAMLDRCWGENCYKVMLLSGNHRDGAHEFYERLGFDTHAKQGFVIRN